MPPITTVARGRWTSEPVPTLKAIGMNPRRNERGRKNWAKPLQRSLDDGLLQRTPLLNPSADQGDHHHAKGFAQQTEVARAFGKTERSVRRYQERYGQAGMAGLGGPGGWRRGRRRISGKRLRLIERLKSAGLSNRAIAQRLGVHENAVRKLVGPSKGEEAEQLALVSVPKGPPIESPTISLGFTGGTTPLDPH